jgi:PAS domain S-box-containing protein
MNSDTVAECGELIELRRALSDFAALSSLPAMWVSADERKIAESAADALLRVLDLDAVRVIHAADKFPEVIRLHESGRTTASDLAETNFLGSDAVSSEVAANNALRGFACTIGISDICRLEAMSRRSNFPTQAERLALTMTANQIAVYSQRAGVETALRAEARALQVLNRTGAAIAAKLDLAEIVQIVTDAGVELAGAEFGAFFYNVRNDTGESYTLYTLSGAPREAFSKFPMPRNTQIFGPTFAGHGIVRSDDILRDPRYGHNPPYKGMPEGHLPVRSYLAVPVHSRSGEVLGGLFFGHSKPGVFGSRAEKLMTGLAGQASIAIDNARLFDASQKEIARRKLAEENLSQLNNTLEERIAEESAHRSKAEERFRLLVDSVTDYAIYMLDPDGRVSSWNRGAERLKGYPVGEIIGEHFSRFYTEEDKEAGIPRIALETAERVGRFEAEGWRVRKDGSRFWANVIVDPIRTDDGRLIGFAKVTRDLTEKRDAEERLPSHRRWNR